LSPSIAIVIDPWDFPFNGGVVSTRRFVSALQDQYAFKLLATPDVNQQADCRMVQFRRVSLPGFNAILNEMKVPLARSDRKLLRQSLAHCELLHVQFPFFLGFAAISEARKLNIPVICSFHVQPENLLLNIGIRAQWLSKLLYKFFIAAFYNRADLTIAPSEFAADTLRAFGLTKPVKVISNGVPEQFLSLQHQLDVQNPDAKRYKILSVGRLAKEKRQDILLQAIARSKYKDSIELIVVGAGPREAKLKSLAARLNLNATIESVSDESLLTHYSEASLFVHTGEIELEGMSVIEAMATGNAVLVSDSVDSATARLVSSSEALFTNGDANDLASKIDYWLAHPEARLAEGQNNRERAGRRSHADSAASLASTYDDFLLSRTL
jgi:1,2-diacylglycerol 3-alpha-glucosyltransferase